MLRRLGRLQRAHHHRFHHHVARGQGIGLLVVLVHHPRQQRLVQRTPVHADAHRLLVLNRALHHHLEVVVVLLPDRRIARIDPVLCQRLRRLRKLLQQQMPVVVKVAHDRHPDSALVQSFHNRRNRRRGFLVVHRNAHNLRPGHGQSGNLLNGARDVGGIGIGHRLHDDRNLPAHANVADLDRGRLPALNLWHSDLFLFSLPSGGILLLLPASGGTYCANTHVIS